MWQLFGLRLLFATVVAASTLASGAAKADMVGSFDLTFSDAVWSDGGTLNGSMTYEYDLTTAKLVSIEAFDINSTYSNGTVNNYYLNTPGKADDTTPTPNGNNPLYSDGNRGGTAFETYLVLPDAVMQIDIFSVLNTSNTGLALSAGAGSGTASCESGHCLSSAGTSVTNQVVVPEPASLIVLGVALTGLGAMRRKARPDIRARYRSALN